MNVYWHLWNVLAFSSSGRYSAAHSSKHGPGNSVRGLCAGVGAAIPSGGSVDRSLDQLQISYEMNRKYQQSQSYKKKRVIKRKKLYELYKIHQEEIQYKKNVSLKEYRARGKKTEHNYSKTNK